MGRSPCCDKTKVRKGAWTPEEDHILVQYIMKHGHGTWRALPKHAGLQRCGKSCRLRWINYLRPDIKRGPFSPEEEATIIRFHEMLGNRWSTIASQLPGRTDNEIKNFWNTHLKKRLPNDSTNIQYQENLQSTKDTTQPESPSSTHPEINSEDNNDMEADVSTKSSPSNSISMDNKNNDFLDWLFDVNDESSGILSGGDMENFGLLMHDMDMIDGSIVSHDVSQDNNKDTEETPTKSATLFNKEDDSSGFQVGAISEPTHAEQNNDSNSAPLDHPTADNQTNQHDKREVTESIIPEPMSPFSRDLEEFLESDLNFLLDFPLEDVDTGGVSTG